MDINSKQDLRKRILTLLREQKEEDRLVKSLAIMDKLFQMQVFQDAKTVLFFASFNGEVHTFEMIKKALNLGKKVALPKIHKLMNQFLPILVTNLDEDLQEGSYGIKEPKNEKEQVLQNHDIDLAIVPGVAFDRQNNRLGRGGGYYDRFLKTLPSTSSTIGLAFDFQIVDSLPCQEHDVPVTCVLTN